MHHQRPVDNLFFPGQVIISHIDSCRPADVVDESDTENGLGLAACGKIHTVEVSSRLQDLGVWCLLDGDGQNLVHYISVS